MEFAGATAVFEALNRADVAYLVVGGLAVNAHGYVRMTMDIDLVVSMASGNITAALYALADIGYRPAVPITPEQFADPANRTRWIAEKGMRVLKLWSPRHPLCPVDIFVEEPFDFAAEHGTAPRFMLDEQLEVPVVRLAALLALKEQAGRPQDLADIAVLREIARGGSASRHTADGSPRDRSRGRVRRLGCMHVGRRPPRRAAARRPHDVPREAPLARGGHSAGPAIS